jgi:Fanconi anemia group M protein
MLEAQKQKHVEHPLIWPGKVEFRLYQKTIADVAAEKNTLVILPTALGKTVISALASANILYNYRDAKILVMAPTRPLVVQHRGTFLKILKLREKDTVVLTGRTPAGHRKAFWNSEARIFFSTPQVVRNDLLDGVFSLEKFSLVVFDECHRAVKEYAYTDIARAYVAQARHPIILGMTASPGSDVNRIQEVCRNLYIERVEFRTEQDVDVKPYIQPIEVEWRRVNLPKEYLTVKSHIRAMLDRRLNWLIANGIIKRKPEYVTRKCLIDAGEELRYLLEAESIEEERGRIFTAIINQSLALTLFHMLELLETQGLHTLKAFMEKVEAEKREKHSYAILAHDPEYRALKSLVYTTTPEHPKVELLKQAIHNQLIWKPSSRMLVFTQYRDTATHLMEQLKSVPNVRAERFVGQATKLNDKGLTQEEQGEMIRKLEEGELNVLVATSIAEEGLDIPAVDHVIFYEPIPSEIRYIQRKGRTGRKAPGKVTILAANETLDMIYFYASRKRAEMMRRIVETLNLKLPTILRRHAKPAPTPLTPEEIAELEREAVRIEVEPEAVKTEVEAIRDFNRKVAQAARTAYIKILERGAEGATVEQLSQEPELEWASPNVIKAALGMMINEDLVAEVEAGMYAVVSAAKPKLRKVYEIEVEKIYPGSAVVLVNDKWRARLEPSDFEGPVNLIKKNSRFKAIAELYKMSGVLHVRVRDIVQKL